MTGGNNYFGIGQDNYSKWFWDNKAEGTYGGITDLTLPEQGSEHHIKIRFDKDDVQFTLDNEETKGVTLTGLQNSGSKNCSSCRILCWHSYNYSIQRF